MPGVRDPHSNIGAAGVRTARSEIGAVWVFDGEGHIGAWIDSIRSCATEERPHFCVDDATTSDDGIGSAQGGSLD